MRRAPALLLFLLAAPLAAQTMISMMKPEEAPPANLQEWIQRVKESGFPEWVLLPGASQDWTAQAGALLDSDPDLMETGLDKESFGTTSAIGRELRAREGWGLESRWALIGSDGTVLDGGRTLPDAAALKGALDRHGVQGKIQVLESFLARHPDRRDAANRLLGYRLQLAGKEMKPFLKPLDLPQGKPVNADLLPPEELAKPLQDSEDARIWSHCAKLLESAIQNADWQQGGNPLWVFRLNPSHAHLSPTMQSVAARGLPMIESALQRDPNDFAAWELWVRMQDIAGGRPIRPLIDSLVPLPLPGSSTLPGEYALGFYIQGAKRRQRWPDIVDLVQPWWDAQRAQHWKILALDMNGKPADSLKDTWDRLLAPLVEAYLRLGRAYEADRVVREAMAWRPSGGLPQWASGLARKCGDDAMASQWARIPVPKSTAP